MGASHAPQPAVVLNGNLIVYLDIASPICTMSVTPGNGVFDFPVPGVLNLLGEYVAGINIPYLPAAVGVNLWISYVVLDAYGLPIATAPETTITILPVF
jgi:hypothetical protein